MYLRSIRLFCFCIIGALSTKAHAEQLIQEHSLPPQMDAATAKDLLLKYSLKQKEANAEARKWYRYIQVMFAYPCMWLKDKENHPNIGNRYKAGWQQSIMLGGKLDRILVELAFEIMQYPTYRLTAPSTTLKEPNQLSTSSKLDHLKLSTSLDHMQFSTSLEGMYLFVNQHNFQLFGLMGGSYLHTTSSSLTHPVNVLIPRVGIGIFWGNDKFGLVSKLTGALRNRIHSGRHSDGLSEWSNFKWSNFKWSNPVTIHIGGRYILK